MALGDQTREFLEAQKSRVECSALELGPAQWKVIAKAMLLGLTGHHMPGNLYMVV